MICGQTRFPGVSVSQVARRYDLNANQVFNWLKDIRFAAGAENTDVARFLPIEVIAEPGSTEAAVTGLRDAPLPQEDCSTVPVPASSEGRIEIALASGDRLTLSGVFDPDLVVRLVRGLSS